MAGPGFLAIDHAVLEVELRGEVQMAVPEWVMDWDEAESEVRKVELLELAEEQEGWVTRLPGEDPYEKIKGLVAQWSKVRADPAKAQRWYDMEVKALGKVVRKLGRGGKGVGRRIGD